MNAILFTPCPPCALTAQALVETVHVTRRSVAWREQIHIGAAIIAIYLITVVSRGRPEATTCAPPPRLPKVQLISFEVNRQEAPWHGGFALMLTNRNPPGPPLPHHCCILGGPLACRISDPFRELPAMTAPLYYLHRLYKGLRPSLTVPFPV